MAGQAPQQNQADNSMASLWITGAILIFGAVIWMSFKLQLIHFYFKIKLVEIDFLSLFTNKLDDVRTSILTVDPNQLNFQDVVSIGQAVGNYLRIPLVAILMVLSVVVFFASTTRVFKRIYSMKELAELEKVNWPQIMPVMKVDLVKMDIDKGPWAMALTPMQFCKRYNLLQEYRRSPQEGMSHREWSKVLVSLKRGEANKLFAIQLGSLWPGVDRLQPHAKAIFAALAARINGETKAAYDLFESINRSSATKLDFKGTDELIHKHANTKLVKQVVETHAYLFTVMAEMLRAARSDGVQATADFLWLKPIDRRLWYVLNTVGRQTPFAEVAGPYAHWIAENQIGRRLLLPMVEEATNALENALKDIIYRPDEPDEKK